MYNISQLASLPKRSQYLPHCCNMFTYTLVSLALLLQARTEWVEITQQHYRKPTRVPHHEVESTEATTPNRVYLNGTSVSPHWSKGNVIKLVAGVGRVEHVPKLSVPKAAKADLQLNHGGKEVIAHIKKIEKPVSFITERPNEKHERKSTHKSEDSFVTERSSATPKYAIVTENTEKDDIIKITEIRSSRKPGDDVTRQSNSVPSHGSSRPPERGTKHIGPMRRQDITRKPTEETNLVAGRPTIFSSTMKPNRSTRVPNRIYINASRASTSKIPSVDEYFVTEKPTFTIDSAEKSTVTISGRIGSYFTGNPYRNKSPNYDNNMNNDDNNLVGEKPPTRTENKKSTNTINRRKDDSISRNSYEKLKIIEQRPTSFQSNKNIYEETTRSNNFKKPAEDFISEPTKDPYETPLDPEDLHIRRIDITSIVDPDTPDFITKQEFIDDYSADGGKHLYIDYEDTVSSMPVTLERNPFSETENKEFTPDVTVTNDSPQHEQSHHKDPVHDPIQAGNDKFDSDLREEENKPNPIENVVKFMKVVSETISKNTRRGIKSKMRYLEGLSDHIIMNIEHRIEETWPEDRAPGARPGRSTREARGHVDFPSSEGALMSISFLTFAVFLIKLITQVIYKYKGQTMMVAPTVFAVSRAADAVAGRAGP